MNDGGNGGGGSVAVDGGGGMMVSVAWAWGSNAMELIMIEKQFITDHVVKCDQCMIENMRKLHDGEHPFHNIKL